MEIDNAIGNINAALRRLGIDNDTFVVFSSDNGAATYAEVEGHTLTSYIHNNYNLLKQHINILLVSYRVLYSYVYYLK